MQRWTRKAASAATALVLATGSIGCSDDDASRLLNQIFINLLGAGEYTQISVTIDPADLGAFIDTTTCDLAAALAGCDLNLSGDDLETLDQGTLSSSTSITFPSGPVTVTISGCPNPIQAFSNLAQCATSEASGGISETITGSGVCAADSACDTTPDICVNNVAADDFCGVVDPTTTSTSSTSSTSTTGSTVDTTSTTQSTTTSSTTSTTIGDVINCEIIFAVTNDVGPLGALSFDTLYPTTGGFEGSGGGVSCSGLVGQFAQFNDIEAENRLVSAIIDAGSGFATPGDVSTCTYVAQNGIPPVAGDFTITVTDASNPDLTPQTGNTNMAISSIVCDVVTTTSTSSSSSSSSSSTSSSSTITTTTNSMTTTTGPGGSSAFDVLFAVDLAATIGALQFEVDYAGLPGGFEGSGQAADCEVIPDIGLGFPAFNNCDTPGGCGALAESTLVVAITSVSGFATAAGEQVVRCTYNVPDGQTPPGTGDFGVTVVDASAPDTTPIAGLGVTTDAVTPQ